MESIDIIRDIRNVYSRYPVPVNLQEHMFRVAAVGELLNSQWKGPRINKENIVAYILLHDIGNIVKFDFAQKELFGVDIAKNMEYWKQQKEETIRKYGPSDMQVTLNFAKQLQVPPRIIELLQRNDFFKLPEIVASNDWENKIGKYADLRVGPFGILSLKERFEEFRKRYGKALLQNPKLETCTTAAFELEKQVLTNTNLTAEDINNDTIKPYMKKYA